MISRVEEIIEERRRVGYRIFGSYNFVIRHTGMLTGLTFGTAFIDYLIVLKKIAPSLNVPRNVAEYFLFIHQYACVAVPFKVWTAATAYLDSYQQYGRAPHLLSKDCVLRHVQRLGRL